MNSEYNKLKVFLDLITFRVKYKELKMAQEISGVYTTIFKEHKPIDIEHFKIIKKYNFKDFKRTVDIHNRYVVNSNEKIQFTDLASTFRSVLIKYLNQNKNMNIFNNLKNIINSFDESMKQTK